MTEELPICKVHTVSKVASLQPGTHVNVLCKVVAARLAAFQGHSRVVEAEVGDETGVTTARFLNAQCDFARLHSTLIFRNVRVASSGRLEVDAYGSIDVCAVRIEVQSS